MELFLLILKKKITYGLIANGIENLKKGYM